MKAFTVFEVREAIKDAVFRSALPYERGDDHSEDIVFFLANAYTPHMREDEYEVKCHGHMAYICQCACQAMLAAEGLTPEESEKCGPVEFFTAFREKHHTNLPYFKIQNDV